MINSKIYVYWINSIEKNIQSIGKTFELFQEASKTSNFTQPIESIHENIKDAIFHILGTQNYQDLVLWNSLCRVTKHWASHMSDAPVNRRPEEIDLSIFNGDVLIDRDELVYMKQVKRNHGRFTEQEAL